MSHLLLSYVALYKGIIFSDWRRREFYYSTLDLSGGKKFSLCPTLNFSRVRFEIETEIQKLIMYSIKSLM